MQNQGAGTGGRLVYVVVWDEQVIPLLRIPQLGVTAIYNNTSDEFTEGTIGWDLGNTCFGFKAQQPLTQEPVT